MANFRSRRLETLLGAEVDQLSSENIEGLRTSGAREDFDLDFKGELYGNTDSDRRKLAGDVAALANTAGGLLILGVAEDDNARAAACPGVALSDAETSRMRQIIATLSPLPHFDIYEVAASPSDPSQGYYVIAVPRSPSAPHAVPINEGVRYPKRNGSTIRYLSEPEIAAAYRFRDLAVEGQSARLDSVEINLHTRLSRSEFTWLTVCLMPELQGDMLIDAESFEAFRDRIVGTSPLFHDGTTFAYAAVGRRRLMAGARQPIGDRYLAVDFHTDGGCGIGSQLGDLRFRVSTETDAPQLISDEAITADLISGLLRVGQFARDDARAGGAASIRAALLQPDNTAVEIGHSRRGFPDTRSRLALAAPPISALAVALLDDLTEPGPPLLRTVRELANQLGQSFGIAEMMQIAQDGSLRRRFWSSGSNNLVLRWAEQSNIRTTDE